MPEKISVTPNFQNRTATKETDYKQNVAPLSFAGTAGETQTFTVETIEDLQVEEDETFIVGLTIQDLLKPLHLSIPGQVRLLTMIHCQQISRQLLQSHVSPAGSILKARYS